MTSTPAWLRDVSRVLAVVHSVSHLDLPRNTLETSLVDSARLGPVALAINRELSQKVVELVGKLPAD